MKGHTGFDFQITTVIDAADLWFGIIEEAGDAVCSPPLAPLPYMIQPDVVKSFR